MLCRCYPKMLKAFRRKFSISAPHLSVRPHLPWYIRWSVTLPFILFAGWLIWWAYDSGLEFAGFHRSIAEKELTELHAHVASLESENSELRNQVATLERHSQIDKSQQIETASQLRVLNEENARLMDDLSFFQNLPLSGVREGELTIHRLSVEPDSLPGEYHCRLLLVHSMRQRSKDFQGHLQWVVNGELAGKKTTLVFPQEDASESPTFPLNFKYYQRVEHSLKIPAEMRLKDVQIRVFEKGSNQPKAKKSITLS